MYRLLLQSQDGKCAICKQPETRSVRGVVSDLVVDHNHETKEIRGLLCSQCNRILGYTRESIELMRSLIAYVEEYNG